MCTPSHCLPIGRTPSWSQWLSVGPPRILGEYVSAAIDEGVFRHTVSCHREKWLDRTCQAARTPSSADTVQHDHHWENVSFPPLATLVGRICRSICRVVRHRDGVQPQPQHHCCVALAKASTRPSACKQLLREEGVGPRHGFLYSNSCRHRNCPWAQSAQLEAGGCWALWHILTA